MGSAIFDYEWQFLIQMISRITYCETYTETCETLLQQLNTLIPFRSGVIFQTGRKNGSAVIGNPISTDDQAGKVDHTSFTNGDYPHWSEFIMAPYSIVFRQSDLVPAAKWEKTRVYREVWQPKDIYWGLFISVVAHDHPLVLLGIHRDKDEEDFAARDIYLMNALKDPLERKFYNLLEGQKKSGNEAFAERIAKTAARHGLTKREIEIVRLVCSNQSGEEICNQLFITPATLSKHLSNIYSKTGSRNRTQLFGLFTEA